MEKAKAGRPKKNRSCDTTDFPKAKTLKELGISRDQSAKWQQLANISDEDFEAALAGPDKPSTSGIIAQFRPKTVTPADRRKVIWLWSRLRDFKRDGHS